MKRAKDPVGLQNNKAIIDGCLWADCTIAAWGNHGLHLDRGNYVVELMKKCGKPVFHLGISKVGQPKHPLYISYEILPTEWLSNHKI